MPPTHPDCACATFRRDPDVARPEELRGGPHSFPRGPVILVPDAAFCLYPLRAPLVTLRPKEHIALLARLDREGTGLAEPSDAHVLVRDWQCVFVEKVLRRLLSFAIKRERAHPELART